MLMAQYSSDYIVNLHLLKDCYMNSHPIANWVAGHSLIRILCSVLAAKTESVITVYMGAFLCAELSVMLGDTDVSFCFYLLGRIAQHGATNAEVSDLKGWGVSRHDCHVSQVNVSAQCYLVILCSLISCSR